MSIPVRPSEHNSILSPGLSSSSIVSGNASPVIPIHLVILPRAGCVEASSGLISPELMSTCMTEWSMVNCLNFPLRKRYARLSPMWARSAVISRTSNSTTVAPIPDNPGFVLLIERTCSLSSVRARVIDKSEHFFPEYDLKEGDEIRLGSTIFKLELGTVEFCSVCSKEIPPEKIAQNKRVANHYVCDDCAKKEAPAKKASPSTAAPNVAAPGAAAPNVAAPSAAAAPKPSVLKPPVPKPAVSCVQCGKDIPKDVAAARGDPPVCDNCVSKSEELLSKPMTSQDVKERLLEIKGYTIIKELGKGGMGVVYLANNNSTGEKVALKVMLAEVAVNEQSRERFLREVDYTKYLKHRNVVQMLDYGSWKGIFYFTLEFCDGGSIDQWMLKMGGRFSVEEALKIILQTLDGLDYAHNLEIPNVKLTDGRVMTLKGLVHRDLKPSNFFFYGSGPNRIAKIADFGLSKAFDAAGLSGFTRTGSAAGTPVFMSRQQVINFKYSKPEADVWSMAASLYYLLTGKFPRDFPKGKDPWYIVLQSRPVPILNRDPKIPKRLAEVIDEALIDQPEIKFKTAIGLKRALEGAL
ncbi:serine/threonine protein kinase [Candidatus Magnetobacterium bavaricum]|uniref:non-specific serine/threonine protein kinase n=1 Tax=Candidatus Magnetobacterium bavaricum TaxID=29290 RepID=A0A0F3GIX6_9BACT|nr:serine/threonine protein kinase [Candidatus Magnetobacterium bavaricum]